MARRDSSAKPQARDPVTLGIFARRLGESMTARRLSALQVAEGAGVDERTVALWLAAEVEPQLFRADQAAQLLRTSLDTLLGSPALPHPSQARLRHRQPLRPPPGGPDPPERAGDHRGGGAGPGRQEQLEPLEGRNGRGYQPLPPISGRAAAMLMLGEE